MWRSAAKGILVAAGVLLLTSRPLLQGIGDFLVAQDPLAQAEAVIAIAGDSEERVSTASRLLLTGYARWLIVSGGPEATPGSAREMAAQARQDGVPPERILLDDLATSTWENAVGSARVMQAHYLRSALLVTSPYHMRRSIIEFRAVFRPLGLEVRAFPVQESFFDVRAWWRRGPERRIVLREYAKLLAFLIGVR